MAPLDSGYTQVEFNLISVQVCTAHGCKSLRFLIKVHCVMMKAWLVSRKVFFFQLKAIRRRILHVFAMRVAPLPQHVHKPWESWFFSRHNLYQMEMSDYYKIRATDCMRAATCCTLGCLWISLLLVKISWKMNIGKAWNQGIAFDLSRIGLKYTYWGHRGGVGGGGWGARAPVNNLGVSTVAVT